MNIPIAHYAASICRIKNPAIREKPDKRLSVESLLVVCHSQSANLPSRSGVPQVDQAVESGAGKNLSIGGERSRPSLSVVPPPGCPQPCNGPFG